MCSYYNGCENTGADCKSGSCPTAFFKPDDTHVQVACQKNNVSDHSPGALFAPFPHFY